MSMEKAPALSSDAELAIAAAKKASKRVMDVYNSEFTADLREGEPVTAADRGSNEILIKELSARSYSILSEESVDNKERLRQSKVWIIDPLDGTSDFVDRTDEFSVLIALVENNVPILGVIYQPARDILWVAEKGRGAYRWTSSGWKKISVSSVSDIHDARVLMSRHHLDTKEEALLKRIGVSQFVQQGSCGLKVAHIAEGNAELYLTMTDKIKQWDTCAASCIITEAGGSMTDMLGNDLSYNTDQANHTNGILVSNGKLSNAVVTAYGQQKNSAK